MKVSRPPQSITDLVELTRWRAEEAPGGRGFKFLEGDGEEPKELSFRALDRRARALGQRLSEMIDVGDRVLLLYPPSLDYVEAFFGCLYAGGVAVPAYPPNPSRLERTLPRLQAIVADSGAAVAMSTEMIGSMASALAMQAPELGEMEWLATDGIDGDGGGGWEPPPVEPSTLAFLQYTSGSTGRPKGVMLEHQTLMANEALINEAFEMSERDVGVHWLPLYHDMGLIGAVIQPVYCGCDSVLMSPLDFLKRPARWLEAIDRFRGTVSTAPNFAFDLAVRKTDEALRDGLDLSSWKVACNGAEPIRHQTLERFAAYFEPSGFDRRAFMPAYGLAEVGLIVSATPKAEEFRALEVQSEEYISCGRPLGDFDVRIVDADTGQECDEGDIGEIWLRKGSVASGYWQRPEVNKEVFDATLGDGYGPFLRTGDLGALVGDQLVVAGRLKDLIIIRGVNHYPQDIESTVESVSSAVRPGCGAAFSVDHEGEEQLVVVQEINPQRCDDPEALARDISHQVASVHRVVPHEVVLIEPRTIEKTSSGKIRRFAARQSFLDDTLQVVARGGEEASAIATEADGKASISDDQATIEGWLRRRISDLSGLDAADIDRRRSFASFGIDSAEAVGIVGELEEALGTTIDATALYDHPTIAALGRYLAGQQSDEPEIRPDGRTLGADREGENWVAIVGMGCRFPKADGLEALWSLLLSGEPAFSEVEPWRWEPGTFTDPEIAGFDTMASDRAGFVEDLDAFDAARFGISPREARAMDPQQRMVMETALRAIEDAHQSPDDLAGTMTGVFIGQSGSDFARLYDGPPVRAATGLAPAVTANRLSYWLDIQGPSSVIDTACSSSLVALDQALLNLQAGRCDQALVGGVNAILAPDMSVAFSQAQMLSPTGECRTFDARANGYVRGEGCGMVLLKPLGRALEDGDPIRAVIRGSAIVQDGQSNGLTAPNRGAQVRVIRQAMAHADVSADAIGAIEAHGTGTELGDAIEVGALRDVFETAAGPSGPTERFLGAIKSQIGHLEAGAGVAGLIKSALICERGTIPPQVGFEDPNPACKLEETRFTIADAPLDWPGRNDIGEPRIMGLSSFGFGGTNAHVILQEPPEQAPSRRADEPRTTTPFSRERHWPKQDAMRRQKAES